MKKYFDIHDLKIDPIHFRSVVDGSKKAEFRVMDRNFKDGDVIRLREWESKWESEDYTGREIHVVITDITDVTKYINDRRDDIPIRGKRFAMLSFRIVPGTLCTIEYSK